MKLCKENASRRFIQCYLNVPVVSYRWYWRRVGKVLPAARPRNRGDGGGVGGGGGGVE